MQRAEQIIKLYQTTAFLILFINLKKVSPTLQPDVWISTFSEWSYV